MAARNIQKLLRSLFADAAAALVFSLVVALVLASLSAAGVIDMTLATILLLVAWLVAIAGTFLIRPIWDMSASGRIFFSVVLAAALGTLWYYEYLHQAEAQSAQATPQSSYAGQQGGQAAGTINNNGPVYNAPVAHGPGIHIEMKDSSVGSIGQDIINAPSGANIQLELENTTIGPVGRDAVHVNPEGSPINPPNSPQSVPGPQDTPEKK